MLSQSLNFFQTKRSLSEIKAELLPAYFKVWAEAVNQEELVLADLNAGNGYEANGENAAAIQIQEAFQEAKNATENEAKTLSLFLSDASKTNLEKLKQSLEIPGEEEPKLPKNIHFLPEPENHETLSNLLEKVPGLLAADPFSYALAEEIISEAIEKTNADLFLLFDYRKLEKTFLAGKDSVFITTLFAEELPEITATYLAEKSPKRREQLLTESLSKTLENHKFYPVSFRINSPVKTTNSTYLVIASKTKPNYFQAKEWLQTFSEFQEDGVPLSGVNLNYQPSSIPGFSDFLNKFSLENLTQELAGCKSDSHYKTIREVYETHSLSTPYILANYLAAFQKLNLAGTVNLVDANNKKMPKVTPEAVVFYRLHTSEPKPIKRLR